MQLEIFTSFARFVDACKSYQDRCQIDQNMSNHSKSNNTILFYATADLQKYFYNTEKGDVSKVILVETSQVALPDADSTGPPMDELAVIHFNVILLVFRK